MSDSPAWTLDELVSRVAAALNGPAYPGAPNGRVRDLPDRRVVRWYTTTGLVDKPAMSGRTAIYHPRQLLQIVAVKKLQAQGLSLAQVQAQLAGVTDEKLRTLAGVTDQDFEFAPAPERAAPPERRSRFWAEPPTKHAANGDVDDTVTALSGVTLPGGAMLLLAAQPDTDDVQAIRAAARPLLALLADRGLLANDERSPS